MLGIKEIPRPWCDIPAQTPALLIETNLICSCVLGKIVCFILIILTDLHPTPLLLLGSSQQQHIQQHLSPVNLQQHQDSELKWSPCGSKRTCLCGLLPPPASRSTRANVSVTVLHCNCLWRRLLTLELWHVRWAIESFCLPGGSSNCRWLEIGHYVVFPTAVLIRIDWSPANLLLLKYAIKLIRRSAQHLRAFFTDHWWGFVFSVC